MVDDVFERMFPGVLKGRPDLHPLWSLMCTSFSLFLQTHTGLPVDFQIQAQSVANSPDTAPEGAERSPLAMFAAPSPRDYAAAMAKEQQ